MNKVKKIECSVHEQLDHFLDDGLWVRTLYKKENNCIFLQKRPKMLEIIRSGKVGIGKFDTTEN